MSDRDRATWHAFRQALADLDRTEPERARLFLLEGAALALRSYARDLKRQPPKPRVH